MIIHKSNAQEILSSESISNPTDSIRKLALDVESLREMYSDTEHNSERARDELSDLKDELFSLKTGLWIVLFLLSLSVVVIFAILSKHT